MKKVLIAILFFVSGILVAWQLASAWGWLSAWGHEPSAIHVTSFFFSLSLALAGLLALRWLRFANWLGLVSALLAVPYFVQFWREIPAVVFSYKCWEAIPLFLLIVSILVAGRMVWLCLVTRSRQSPPADKVGGGCM